ncbi:MAG: glycosyltransferase family 2 protein [Vicinamibacteria bacterium]
MTASPSLVSIVLPVHNQGDHVAGVVREYEASLARLPVPHEILLVVNGSSDSSIHECRELEKEHPSIRVLESVEGGWGRAVLLGLESARGDVLCYTNLARTRAEDLTLLLLYAFVHSDVVVKANRKIRDSVYRRFGSLLYNLECRALFDLSYWDINGTPKVFSRSLEKLLELTRKDDLVDLEFNVVCRREGYRVLEVPVFSNVRHGGRSTTSHGAALKLYLGALSMWRSHRKGMRA